MFSKSIENRTRERGGGEEKEEKKRKKHGIFIHRISRYSLVAKTTGGGKGDRDRRGERARKRRMDDARARAPRDRRERERERVLLRSLHREMVNGDNEARDKSGEGAS